MPGRTVGLIGFGRWGRLVFRDLTALGAGVLVAAPSEAARRRAEDSGAAATVASVEDLPEVDGVVVATPTSTHAEIIERALDRLEVPIFVEKPLACDVEDARRIAGRAPDLVFVMEKWRYHPGVEALRDLARSGRLGSIIGLRSSRMQWGLQHRDVDGIWILLPHDLSITREILGRLPEPRLAFGAAQGRHVDLVAALGADPWVRIEVSTRFPEHRREVHVLMEEGVASLTDSYADRVHVRPVEGELEEIRIPTEMPLLRELRAFLDHLDGGPPPMSSAAEGAEVVEAIAAVRVLAGLDPEPG